jgi:hypothetical protein
MKTCRHCQRPRRIFGRGLCQACYKDAAIKSQYPPLSRGGKRPRGLGVPATGRIGIECWACGVVGPYPAPGWAEKSGWATRKILLPCSCLPVSESYCPECFAEWGWPELACATATG